MLIQKDKNMLLRTEHQYTFEEEIDDLGKLNDDALKLHLDDIDNIVLINKKKSNEDQHVISSSEDENMSINGDWVEFDEKLFRSYLSFDYQNDPENYIVLNDNNEYEGCIDPYSSQKEIENNNNNCPNIKLNIIQEQLTLSENFVRQNTSNCLVRKSSIGTFNSNNVNEYPMNPRVVLEKLSDSSIKQIKKKLTATKARSIKIEKARYRCSDCHFKTNRKKKYICHLDETSHDSVYDKRQIISNGNFCSVNQGKINNEHKTNSKLHYKLRKYSNKWFCCSYNKCHFTAKDWRLMYSHVKFAHLHMYRLKKYKNKQRIKYILKDAKSNNKLEMRALIILQRLPTYIVNSESPIPMKLWFPYSRGIVLKDLPAYRKRKIISTIEKYPCAFDNCMFVSTNWKSMHRHVKLCHLKSRKSSNI